MGMCSIKVTCIVSPYLSAVYCAGYWEQIASAGASLVTQWWGFCLPVQETGVQSLVQEDPTGFGAAKPMCHNCWACALEPMLNNKRRHCNEKPVHCNWRAAPAHWNQRETACAPTKTQHKNKKINLKKRDPLPSRTSGTVMINLRCQLDWPLDWHAQFKHYFWVCVRVFLNEISIWISGLSNAGAHHSIPWGP